jgi:hypothetical protein
LAVWLCWWLMPALNLANYKKVGEPVWRQPSEVEPQLELEFDTKNPLQPTPVWLTADEVYNIRVTVTESWIDAIHEASPKGLKNTPPLMRWLSATKRVKEQPWFMLMGSVGPDEQELIPIGDGLVFSPKTSGRLYLFVNDASGFYKNNKGKAKVVIDRCGK